MYKKGCVYLVILNNIISLLKEQNKKQIDLTNHLGLSKNIFSEWKSGRSTSYMKRLPDIAEFFGVSVDYLLGKESPIAKNDFTYALYNELAHDLSEEDIQQLKQFADFLRNSKNK